MIPLSLRRDDIFGPIPSIKVSLSALLFLPAAFLAVVFLAADFLALAFLGANAISACCKFSVLGGKERPHHHQLVFEQHPMMH